MMVSEEKYSAASLTLELNTAEVPFQLNAAL